MLSVCKQKKEDSATLKTSKIKQKANRCLICGDKGVGIKYCVPACYSCKTFFQRNGDRFEKLKCPKTGNCPVDVASRKSCPKCRLSKMLSLGMRMTSSSQKQLLRTLEPPKVFMTESKSTSTYIDSLVDRLVYKEGLITSSPTSSSSSSSTSSLNLSSSSSPFFTPHRYRYHFATTLNLEERKQLSELATSINSVFADERLLPKQGLLSDLADAFNWPANYVTKVIAFCRSLPSYACLPQSDQLAVLKKFYMECLTLRTSFNYDPAANGYPVLANDQGTKIIFCSYDHLIPVDFKHPELIDLNRDFTKEWHQLLGGDEQLFCLMTGFFLFYDKRGLQRQEFARYEHAKSCRLLLKFLEQKYRNIEAAGKAYNRLLSAVQRLKKLKTANVAFLEIIPNRDCGYQFPGVLSELFNIQL